MNIFGTFWIKSSARHILNSTPILFFVGARAKGALSVLHHQALARRYSCVDESTVSTGCCNLRACSSESER